jgi:predicted RNase H-like HicB family nuclease
MVFTKPIVVAKRYVVYVLRSSYRGKGGFLKKQPLPVHAAIQKLRCKNIETEGIQDAAMNLTVEIEQEEDGRWIAEVIGLPGVLVYAQTCEDAITRVQALALRVLADRLEHGEGGSMLVSISFQAA